VKALKRNNILHAVYMNQIGSIVADMDQVMCVDESAKDDQTQVVMYQAWLGLKALALVGLGLYTIYGYYCRPLLKA